VSFQVAQLGVDLVVHGSHGGQALVRQLDGPCGGERVEIRPFEVDHEDGQLLVPADPVWIFAGQVIDLSDP
jgi:hypothetical protein